MRAIKSRAGRRMAMKHLLELPDHIVGRCIDWEREHPPIKNQYTSHGIEHRTAEERAAHKLCEFAFASWCGVSFSEIQFSPDDGNDLMVYGDRYDVKCCVISHFLLCWPYNKVDLFNSKKFDRLVLVKYDEALLFECVGWITKERFRRDWLVATGVGRPALTKETRYLHQDKLDRMETIGDWY